MNHRRIRYFDNNATTQVAAEVLDEMTSCLKENWGNPSSVHELGREAATALYIARERVAALIHAETQEIVFTSSGTESINSALQAAMTAFPKKRHLLTTAVEHPAVLRCGDQLQGRGFEVSIC